MIRDLRALQDQGSPGLLAQLVDIFLKQTVEKLGEMRQLLKAKNGPLLGRIAHTLKGSAGSLGAMHLSKLFEALEHALREDAWNEVEVRVSDIETEFERVRVALDVERKR